MGWGFLLRSISPTVKEDQFQSLVSHNVTAFIGVAMKHGVSGAKLILGRLIESPDVKTALQAWIQPLHLDHQLHIGVIRYFKDVLTGPHCRLHGVSVVWGSCFHVVKVVWLTGAGNSMYR